MNIYSILSHKKNLKSIDLDFKLHKIAKIGLQISLNRNEYDFMKFIQTYY